MHQMSSFLHLGLDAMCMMHVEYSLLLVRECVGFVSQNKPTRSLQHLHSLYVFVHSKNDIVVLTKTFVILYVAGPCKLYWYLMLSPQLLWAVLWSHDKERL